MQNAEDELKRRRERGRKAQAAFRKRQAEASRDIQEENDRLREALGAIAATARSDDRGELLSVIKQGAEASGMDTSHLNSPDPSSEQSGPDDTGKCQIELPSPEDSLTTHKPASSNRQPQPGNKHMFKATRCMMWLNPMRYMRIETAPEDIVPYIGPGANTLAGKLFWTVMEHALSECQHVHHPTNHETFTQYPLLKRMMAHTAALQDVSHDYLKAMIEARLEFRQMGFISAEYASAAEPDGAIAMKRKIVKDYMLQGKNANVWLDPMAVETRIRSLLGPDDFKRLEYAARSPDNSVEHNALVSAVNKLVEHFICFGDGPRWSNQIVRETFNTWLRETRK